MDEIQKLQTTIIDLRSVINKLVYHTEHVRKCQEQFFRGGKMKADLEKSKKAERELDALITALKKRGFGTPPQTLQQNKMF